MNQGATSVPAAAPRATTLAKLGDYFELTKPRIVALELVAIAVTLHIATGYGDPGSTWSASVLLSCAMGASLIAGSANAINQWIERERDAIMPRTKNRPIPAGRIAPNEALVFGVVTLALGFSVLGMFCGTEPALIAMGTWLVYVVLYTPLKTRTWLNTAVGAISGAMPLWIGWSAGGGDPLDPLALSIVAVMYLWQFPHFMAIAWLCRDDYQLAGYQMSTMLDPTGRWAGLQAVFGSALLLPVSFLPVLFWPRMNAGAYLVTITIVGIVMLAASASFLARRNDLSARRLMRASLIYVPVWLLALWCCGA